MKVLLIYPPAGHMIKTNVPEFVDKETGVYPPLGLLYVAGYLSANSGHEVTVIDTQAEGLDEAQLEERIRAIMPDVVGIQAFTFTLIDALNTARIVKKVDRGISVCMGGPHVNIYPEETIAFREVDFLIQGEGEISFKKLIDALDGKEDMASVEGLVYKKGGDIIKNRVSGYIEDLDGLAFPARSLTLYQRYYSLLATHTPVTTMMSSRGCPFHCLFCDRPHLGKKFRARSAKNVVDEIEECVKMGIKEFFFYDDTFCVNKKRVYDICREIKQRALDIVWDIRTRIDTVDRGLLRELRSSGCQRIHYGVEAGTEKILKVLKKEIDLKRARDIFRATREEGITTLAYFMIGSPGETKEDILKTIDFALGLGADFVHFSVTTPFPATALYRLGLEKGILKRDYWREFAISPHPSFTPELWEENLSREELSSLLKMAYKRFYSRPSYIIKELMKVKTAGEFFRKVRAGLKVVTS